MEIPLTVQSMFVAAGWKPGRESDIDVRVPQSHPAYRILKELGGLHVGRCEPGVECATSDLAFGFLEGDREIVSVWNELLRSRLVGIAEVHHRHGWLLIDEAGQCFGASQIHDAFYYEGPSFGVALEGLLIGRKARPMLRPDQDQVELYGQTFSRGHPEIFVYRTA
ncbi:conserved hypothetical protein [Bradyrhizobium sp. STM 3843]|uniref:SUKH-3 domain-containing protein n=1 Tax=Bradyrhizobium sp. STM 3843 TaxID=551947 RepID=UPI000240AF8F|nr:SUKH-3 domain-containing protein [Bradyrhizobium sp. STM 3843]CCE05873.1 conserved hypothetical protein [Bradyrhizobium sp. STM 3843]